MSQPDVDLIPVIRQLDAGQTRVSQLSEHVALALCARLGLDRDAIQALFDDRIEREQRAPAPGGPAPDFNLELIEADGSRNGERRRLWDYLDKPVALIFGSYT